MMKAISKLGDKVNAYATKMEETDQWFEDKTFVIDNLDQQLRKLLTATEAMVDYRWEKEINVKWNVKCCITSERKRVRLKVLYIFSDIKSKENV